MVEALGSGSIPHVQEQESASRVLENFQATTYRLYKSIMATRYRKPLAMGI